MMLVSTGSHMPSREPAVICEPTLSNTSHCTFFMSNCAFSLARSALSISVTGMPVSAVKGLAQDFSTASR